MSVIQKITNSLRDKIAAKRGRETKKNCDELLGNLSYEKYFYTEVKAEKSSCPH